MDDIERGQEREQQDRAMCLAIALSHPQRDYEAEICPGCSYATKSNYGKRCEGWVDCLADLQKRESAGR